MQDVLDDHGSENVEFEVTIGATDSDSSLVAHNLAADHSQSFTLSGVDLSGHDGASWFVFRKEEFTETTTRAGSQESNIVGDLENYLSKCQKYLILPSSKRKQECSKHHGIQRGRRWWPRTRIYLGQ